MIQKSRNRITYCILKCVAVTCLAVTAHAAGAATVSGNVAGWVAKAAKTGAARSDEAVTIAVHLRLKDPAALKQLVAAVSSPQSKEYGHYLTPDAFAARFAPAAADVAAVKSLLEHAGMTEVKEGPHGVYVSATATVAQLRTTFNVSQDLYSYSGRTLRANKEEPTVPAALAGKVVYIGGLDESGLLRKPYLRSATLGKLVAPAVNTADAVNSPDTAARTGSSPAVTPPPVAANNPSPYCNEQYGAGALVANLSTAADVYGAAIPWLNCGYTPQQIQTA